MPISSWFWLFWVLALLSYFGWTFLPADRRPYGGAAFGLFVLVAIGLVGWSEFGKIIKGQ